MPHVVLDELLNLVLPLWLEHDLLYRLHCDHQPVDVLDEDVIARDEKLLAATLAALAN